MNTKTLVNTIKKSGKELQERKEVNRTKYNVNLGNGLNLTFSENITEPNKVRVVFLEFESGASPEHLRSIEAVKSYLA